MDITALPWDEALYEQLSKDNEKELEAIQKEEDEATEKAGETEIQTARGKRAEFWTRVGDKVYLNIDLFIFHANETFTTGQGNCSIRSCI